MMSQAGEVARLRKAGRLDEAYTLGLECLLESPTDGWLAKSFGWVLFEKAKNATRLANKSKAETPGALAVLEEAIADYMALPVEVPDLLYSLMVAQVKNFPGAEDLLHEIVAWGGLTAFRAEDFVPDQPKNSDQKFKSLVESVSVSLGKAAAGNGDVSRAEFALSVIDLALRDAELLEPHWLHYRRGLLFSQLGRREEAMAELLPVVRKQRHEYWAWEALGNVYEPSDHRIALSLYAMASLTCTNPDFSVRVNESLARLAATLQRYPLAKWAAESTFAHRESRGWKVPASLQALRSEPWYLSTEAEPDARGTLVHLSQMAEEILYADATDVNGTYLGSFEAKVGRTIHKVAVRNGVKSTVVTASAIPSLTGAVLALGAPVRVSVVRDGSATIVRDFVARSKGAAFDMLDREVGVVDHQNHNRGLVSLYLPRDEFVPLHYREFPEATTLEPGTPVEIIAVEVGRRRRAFYYEVVKALPPDTSWIRLVTGVVRQTDGGFGFLDDVFVPPPIVANCPEFEDVTLVAVRTMNKKKRQMGWKAIARST